MNILLEGAFQTSGEIAWPGTCFWGEQALARALDAAGPRLEHALVVTDAGVWGAVGASVEQALAAVPGLQWHVYSDVSPNPQIAQVRKALAMARELRCSSVVAVGGGSAMDVAKLVQACMGSGLDADQLHTPVGQAWLDGAVAQGDPLLLAIPTTSGTGSESSSAAIIQADDGRKRLLRSLRTRPALVALQPQLSLSLPLAATGQGGFDAVLHALGAWVNTDPSPIGKAMALHALRICMQALPQVLQAPLSLRARADMQMGSYLAGLAIGMSKVDAVHGMCTPLESRMHLAHAQVLGPVFSVVTRYTVERAASPYAEAARALGIANTGQARSDALALVEAVESLAAQAQISLRFTDLALTQEDALQLARQAQASASTPLHPCVLSLQEMQSLYLKMSV